MTQQMILSAPLSGYGACELKQKLHKNVLTGLTLATIIYGMLLGSYWSSVYLTGADDDSIIFVPKPPIEWWPQPGIVQLKDPLIGVAVAAHPGKPNFGTPVPVPEVTLKSDIPFAKQTEVSAAGQPGEGTDQGDIIIPPATPVGDEPPPPFVPVEKLPIIVKRVNPVYPELARRGELEGRVWAKVWIDKQGKVRQVVIIKSDSEFFNKAVIEAVKQWSFAPALMNNGPVDVWMSLPFVFKLNK